MNFLLDTNVISELRKRSDRMDANVASWATELNADDAFISAVTISELSQWVAATSRRDGPQGALLDRWLNERVLLTYAGHILPLDTDVALITGRLHVPDPRDYRDAFIAATAIHHDLTVATRNVKDFEPIGVPVLNPFDPR